MVGRTKVLPTASDVPTNTGSSVLCRTCYVRSGAKHLPTTLVGGRYR